MSLLRSLLPCSLVGLSLGACGDSASPRGTVPQDIAAKSGTPAVRRAPSAAPPTFAPRMPELARLAANEPAAPDATRAANLADLVATAFGEEAADLSRLRARARSSLLGHEHAVWALEQALADAAPVVRSNAAFELANLGHHPSIPVLLRFLKEETDAGTRLYLADAVARLDNFAGLPVLITAMRDPALAERAGQMAIHLAEQCGQPAGTGSTYAALIEILDRLHRLWRGTGQAPGRPERAIDDRTQARAARLLMDLEEFQLRHVDRARYVLGRMGRNVLPLLETTLFAAETYLRQHTLEILREMGRPAAGLAPQVLTLLGDPLARAEAAETLGAIRATAAIPRLRQLLADPSTEVRCAAAGALGPLGAHEATPTLAGILADEQQPLDLRVQAAFSLALLDARSDGVPFLLRCQQDDSYHGPTLRLLLDRIAAGY